jgi:23S rRNA (uracil1939-C5)-methyltransferase
VNYKAAEKLCIRAAELAAPMPGEFGADLYCGTGTIGLVTASLFSGSYITGVEINEKAVADAKENAKNNGLDNLGYYSGDSADFVKSSYGAIDFAIIDPPRAGCSDRMIKDLTKLKPSRIVCVSCAPDTLARDLKKLRYVDGVLQYDGIDVPVVLTQKRVDENIVTICCVRDFKNVEMVAFP